MNTQHVVYGNIIFFIVAIAAFALVPFPARAIVPVDCFPNSFSNLLLTACRVWDVGYTGEPDTLGLPAVPGVPGTTLLSVKKGWGWSKEVSALDVFTNPAQALQGALSAFSWDSFAWFFARQILHVFTQNMVSWIRTGQFGGGPLFTTDLVGELFNAADNAAGHFLAQYRSEEWYQLLCSPFRAQIYLALGSGRVSYINRARCTVTDIVNNLENFYTDFSNGGWAAWFATIEPQNNPYGLYLLSLEEKEQREREVTFDIRHNFLAGQGFIGLKQCAPGHLLSKLNQQNPTLGTPNPTEYCDKYITVTPGKVVQDQLSQALNTDLSKLGVADEMNEVIVAAFDELLSWLVSGGSNGGGLLESNLPDLPPIEPTCSTDTGRPNGCGCATATQCATNFCSLDNICTPPTAVAECSDKIDNDKDGLIDFPADPQCTSAEDNSEGEISSQGLMIISTSPLPSGAAGALYPSFAFKAQGGTPYAPEASTFPYLWVAVDTGTHPLPAGLTLSQGGILSGTPSAAGTWTFTVKVTDSVASSTQSSFILTIAP